jgi:AcrR family transcriptional regulator
MTAEARREQLLDVAKALVVRRGFHAVSIEAVARDAGISRPIVYGHFHDLPGLLEALVKREGLRALGQLDAVLPAAFREPDPRERLVLALGAYLEAVRADPDTWRLVLMPPEGAPRVLHEEIARGRAAVVAQLASALGPEAGAAAPDPELAARLLSALADEAARLLLAEPERYPADRILRLARWFVERL